VHFILQAQVEFTVITSGARDNDIPHKLVSIEPILVIFVSDGMFWGMLNSFMTL